jgi:hypothetical protein
MPAPMFEERRANGNAFWCPNGHNLSFKKTSVQILREKLEREVARRNTLVSDAYDFANRERERREAAERSRTSLKGANTRLRQRLAKAGGSGE